MEGPRACRQDELPGLRQLADRVFRPGGESSIFDEFPTLFNPENCERLRVIVDDGRPVSSINYVVRPVVIYGNVLQVGSLGAVSTYEEFRGRGLATQLLQDAFAQMRREAVDVVLISGQRGLYQRAGCALGGHEVRFSLERSALDRISGQEGLTVTHATDDDIPTLAAIHHGEPARYVRSPWDWRQYLKVCRLAAKGVEQPFGVRRCWLVRRDDRPLAYVVLALGRDRHTPTGGVVEFAGSRRAVGAALRILAERFDLRSIGARTLPEDREMLDMLDLLGVAAEYRLLGGHRLGILTTDVFSRYRAWLVERIGSDAAETLGVIESAGVWSVTVGKASVRAGDAEALNAALFGDSADQLSGDREAVALLKQALPLPWLLPGMNYI